MTYRGDFQGLLSEGCFPYCKVWMLDERKQLKEQLYNSLNSKSGAVNLGTKRTKV